MISHLQASAKATLLDFIVTKLSGDLGLDIFNDLCPNGWGSRGDFSIRPSRPADIPDFLWFPCKTLQVVLRGRLSTSACLSSVSNPAATSTSIP